MIAAHLERALPGDGDRRHSFRVTRDAELGIAEDDADDLLAAVESGLSGVSAAEPASFGSRQRTRCGAAASTCWPLELELERRRRSTAWRLPLDLSGLSEALRCSRARI